MGKLTICGQLKHQTQLTLGNNFSKAVIALLLVMLVAGSGCPEESPIKKELEKNGFDVVYVDSEEGVTYVGYAQEDDFEEKELYAKFAYIFGVILVHSADSSAVGAEAIFDDGESIIGYTDAETASKFINDEISVEEFVMNLDIEYLENGAPDEVFADR